MTTSVDTNPLSDRWKACLTSVIQRKLVLHTFSLLNFSDPTKAGFTYFSTHPIDKLITMPFKKALENNFKFGSVIVMFSSMIYLVISYIFVGVSSKRELNIL